MYIETSYNHITTLTQYTPIDSRTKFRLTLYLVDNSLSDGSFSPTLNPSLSIFCLISDTISVCNKFMLSPLHSHFLLNYLLSIFSRKDKLLSVIEFNRYSTLQKSIVVVISFGTTTHFISAALAACAPFAESSKTKH